MPLNIEVVFVPSSNSVLFGNDSEANARKALVRRAANELAKFLEGEPSPSQVAQGTIFNFAPPTGSSFNLKPSF